MRIGHYANDLAARGGIASYVFRVGRAQESSGHEVVYLSRATKENEPFSLTKVESDRDLFAQAQTLDLNVLHLHRPVETLPKDRVPTVRTMHGNHGSCPSGSRYLKRTGTPCNRTYSAAGCLWGHLVDHCGSRRPEEMTDNFTNFRLEQEQAAELPTIAVSRFLKEKMVQSGCPPNNLHVVHSPAPEIKSSFSPLPRRTSPHFVFAGRIEPKKGLDWLLRALAKVETDVHLDVAGTGNDPYLEHLKELASDLSVQDRVTFRGWLEQKEVYSLIDRSRGLVFPSVWHEPAGLVTLEAAALGRPVIASEVGGIPEYATDDFALRVSPRNVDGLAAAIEELANDAPQAEEMGRKGRSLARTRYSMDDFLDRLHELYRRVQPQDIRTPRGAIARHSVQA